jgi:PIN domain nuclease of toxin-antitoxin system
VIVLDTHIWIWWVHGSEQLPASYRAYLEQQEGQGLGVSAISCWEIAKLVEYGRLLLPCAVGAWLDQALSYPGMHLLALTPEIAIASTQLPGVFHRDPADQIIVATARVHRCPLATLDARILAYPHIEVWPS